VVASLAPERYGQPATVAVDPLLAGLHQTARSVVRLPPGEDPFTVVDAMLALGPLLVLCPTVTSARTAFARLQSAGVRVAGYPRDWAVGAGGATVVGTRSAAWAPVAGLAGIVVVDEHDEAHQQEQTPTWSARDVACERADRAEIPCALVSPTPSL
jgi:primosomal protein N' (replication factor Y)